MSPAGKAMIAEIVLGAGAVVAAAAVTILVRRRQSAPAEPTETAEAVEPSDDLRPAIDAMQLGVTITNTQGKIVYSNPADAAMHGYDPAELIGQPGSIFAPPATRRTVTTGEVPTLRSWRREALNIRKDGEVFPVRLRSDIVLDGAGRVQGFVTTCEDVTDEKRMRAAEAAGTLQDPLTGLGNRTFFLELVARAIRRAERHADYHFAVLCLDIERFKLINESLGHDAGDALLVQVADRLRDAIRPNDVAARLAGDEFVLLLDSLRAPEDATTVAQRIIVGFEESFTLREREMYLTASLGIAPGRAGQRDPDQYIKDSREAMYSARGAGQTLYGVFEETARRRVTRRLQLETDLRKAIDEQELRAVYQPIVDLSTKRTIGFEALVRWLHSRQGMIAPGEFIPAAEETGLVVPIGWWMVETASRDLAGWRREFPNASIAVNVNLSVRQLQQPRLVDRILGILQVAGVPPASLKLEVTESMVMDDPAAQIDVLRRLRAAGIGVVIDDFGTGYSSLAYLQRFDFDVLKIDRSFLGGEDEQGWDIVKVIIDLAHDKGAAVVAEGIEHEYQANRLRELGCTWGQGYWFAKPLDPDAATARLREEFGRSSRAPTP